MINSSRSPEPDGGNETTPTFARPVELPEPEEPTYWSDTQVLEVLHDAHATGSSLTRALLEYKDLPRSPNEEAPRRATVRERPRPSLFSALKSLFRRGAK